MFGISCVATMKIHSRHSCMRFSQPFIVLFIWLVCRANGVHVQIVVTATLGFFRFSAELVLCVCVCVAFKLIVWLDVALANASNKSLDFYLMCLECTRTFVAVYGTAKDGNDDDENFIAFSGKEREEREHTSICCESTWMPSHQIHETA